MSGAAELDMRFKHPTVVVDGNLPLGGWENSYVIPGHTRECHPDFIATPIGNNPYGFLVCNRKPDPGRIPIPRPDNKCRGKHMYSQTYDLYSNDPTKQPRRYDLGGAPDLVQDRRLPNQAQLQGLDYYRDSIKYRGIGTERINARPGEFGYVENKYRFSTAPPLFDITQAVQPYELWRHEQLRMGTFTQEQMAQFDKENNYIISSATY